jgi:hypothetical protein
MNVIHTSSRTAWLWAFGGQTAIKLTRYLSEQGVRILEPCG